MKKTYILFALAILVISACNDDKATEKALLDDVIKIHDEVMGKEDYLMRNKMKMDTILMRDSLNRKYTAEEKATISAVRAKLVAADQAMSAWMEHFDTELKGKSHQEKMEYYTKQKKEVTRIDSVYKVVIEGSDKYLKEIKK